VSRLPIRTVYLAVVLLTTGGSSVFAAETVQSLRYGVSLFHYFQQDYFDALTELMVGQASDALGPHTEGSELLRGGMALSYGMDKQAERIFNEQLVAGDHPDRSRAWFFLGKAAWQRGDLSRTLEALDAMGQSRDEELLAEANYLHASALMRTGKTSAAKALIDSMPTDSKWHYYLQYNAAAQRALQGDWAAAQEHFSTFEDMQRIDAEHVALFERAQTAAGYAYLAADQPVAARGAFEQIGLEGAASEKALLGFGWAAARQGDYLSALSAWRPLTERPMLYVTARESLMAMPYAYEQLGHSEVALEQYRHASDVYAEQLSELKNAIREFRDRSMESLLGLEATSFEEAAVMGWLEPEAIFPEADYAPYLQFLITRHGFQVALRELRDLYDMRHRLRSAQQRLDVLREVDGHQQAMWRAVISQDRQKVYQVSTRSLQLQFDELRKKVEHAVLQDNSRALADAQTKARWRRIERAVSTASALNDPEKLTRAQRLRGLQLWEDSERFAQRAWQAKQSLESLARTLAESVDAQGAVSKALKVRKNYQAAQRIDALEQGIDRQLQSVERIIERAEQGTRSLAIAALEEQAEQLQRALGQSGLAVARLYDLNSAEIAP